MDTMFDSRIPGEPPGVNAPADGAASTEPVLLGVSARLSERMGFSVAAIRFVFVILTAAGAVGIVAYLLMTIVVDRGRLHYERRTASADIGLAVVGLAAALWLCTFWPLATYPAVIVTTALAGAVAYGWQPISLDDASTGRSIVVRVLVGGSISIIGLVAALGSTDSLESLGTTAIWFVLALSGALLVAAPSMMALSNAHRREHDARVREAERAAMAAHLHDSVLQTLTLISRSPSDSANVARLARRQERELRRWLYEATDATSDTDWPSWLRATAESVEDDYGVGIELISVGTSAASPAARAACAAAKEAMVNAAKFSGDTRLSVYAEEADGRLTIFVRDRGVGFDPAAVPGTRRGIADSIVARMARAGGSASIHSSPGSGTEVTVSVPLERAPSGEGNIEQPDTSKPDTEL